jgi:hypothetical protein
MPRIKVDRRDHNQKEFRKKKCAAGPAIVLRVRKLIKII